MKKALVTGGATGIGKATALLLAKNGYDVFITYNATEPDFDGVTAVKCDLTSVEQIDSLLEETGDIDLLVNNAGVSLIKQINDTTEAEYDSLFDVNAKSYYFTCKAALKGMLKNHSGAIVNVSSMWGQTGASCEVAYSMSKFAVIGLTKSLAAEVALSGVTVNCVAPGIIDTRMNASLDADELKKGIPLGRLGTPDEVARAVLFLAQNGYITGQVLGVNGGIVL